MVYRRKPNATLPYKIALACVIVLLFALVIYVFFWEKPPTSVVLQMSSPPPVTTMADPVLVRDQRVLDDPLYPPLARQGADNTRALMGEPRLHPSRTASDSFDTYRLAGYLVSQEDRGDTWKLFAREKYPRRGDADFFVSSANRNMEYKLPLTPDMTSPRLRDVYSLPDHVSINHPFFAPAPYSVVQLPPPNLVSGYF